MIWQVLYTIFLLALVAEAGREAFFPGRHIKAWDSQHYSRMQIAKELPWWAERKSRREKREHQRKWHIDLLAMMKPRKRV